MLILVSGSRALSAPGRRACDYKPHRKSKANRKFLLKSFDRFFAFKSAMLDLRVAREFFEQHLPEHIKPLVNLKSLNLEPCSFVDEKLKPSATDLLYRTQFNFK